MRGRKIEEIEGSSRGMYIRNADTMPNWNDMCITAGIPTLYKIPNPAFNKGHQYISM